MLPSLVRTVFFLWEHSGIFPESVFRNETQDDRILKLIGLISTLLVPWIIFVLLSCIVIPCDLATLFYKLTIPTDDPLGSVLRPTLQPFVGNFTKVIQIGIFAPLAIASLAVVYPFFNALNPFTILAGWTAAIFIVFPITWICIGCQTLLLRIRRLRELFGFDVSEMNLLYSQFATAGLTGIFLYYVRIYDPSGTYKPTMDRVYWLAVVRPSMSHASGDLISLFDARENLRIFKQTAIFRPACKLAGDIESRNGVLSTQCFR